jgi:hypothetical protein
MPTARSRDRAEVTAGAGAVLDHDGLPDGAVANRNIRRRVEGM